jgi:hypothetical protein
MIGSVELFIILIISLIYLGIPLVTLVMVIMINQRLKHVEDLIDRPQE